MSVSSVARAGELCDFRRVENGLRCTRCQRFVEGQFPVTAKRICTGPADSNSYSHPAEFATERMPLLLKCPLSPGDILTLTAAIYSLHRTYPGEYLTDTDTPCRPLFDHNPDVTPLDRQDKRVRVLGMEYPSVHRSNQELAPFLAGYCENLGQKIGRPLRLRTNRPHLYLSDEESAMPPWIESPYWIVNAGVKSDFTLKQWHGIP
jgi:hypothetical protein